MLWMKGWLETRWRFCLWIGFGTLTLVVAGQGGGLQSAEHARNLMLLQEMIAIIAAINLAGAGIRTQSPFRAKAGLHGSTQYTLSMPVSRLRLLSVRAAVGMLETAGVIVFMIVSAWSLFPLIRGNSTLGDLLKLLLTALVCVSCFYFMSVAIAAVLDEMWQVYGSYCLAGLAWWASTHLALPASANIFSFSTGASPLATHTLPWPALAISLAVSIALFLVALAVVTRHDY